MKGIEAIKGFKEKYGPVKKELLDWIRYTNTSMAAIKKSLAAGEKTVPQVAEETKLPQADCLWFINAMRKYGDVIITGDADGFKKYALKETNK
jgi:hypothetical protein